MLRFDPFRDLDRLSSEVARTSAMSVLQMDAVRDEHEVLIYFDVPGCSSDDIDVSVEKNELTVTVQRRWSDEGKQVLSSERPQGEFTRRVMLGDALDLDHLKAKITEGVLVIAVPVSERSKPRRIDVETSSSDEAIATTSTDA